LNRVDHVVLQLGVEVEISNRDEEVVGLHSKGEKRCIGFHLVDEIPDVDVAIEVLGRRNGR